MRCNAVSFLSFFRVIVSLSPPLPPSIYASSLFKGQTVQSSLGIDSDDALRRGFPYRVTPLRATIFIARLLCLASHGNRPHVSPSSPVRFLFYLPSLSCSLSFSPSSHGGQITQLRTRAHESLLYPFRVYGLFISLVRSRKKYACSTSRTRCWPNARSFVAQTIRVRMNERARARITYSTYAYTHTHTQNETNQDARYDTIRYDTTRYDTIRDEPPCHTHLLDLFHNSCYHSSSLLSSSMWSP